MVKLSLIEGLDGMSVIEVINLIFPFPTNQVYILASCIWQPFKVSVFYKGKKRTTKLSSSNGFMRTFWSDSFSLPENCDYRRPL